MRWLLALVVVGCGGKPGASPALVEQRPARSVEIPVAAGAEVPRPNIALAAHIPDFREELRWPLPAMSHPDLAAQYDVAKDLAMPGVGWIELCERGVHKRTTSGRDKDTLEYLAGWCAAIDKDVDKACAKLVPLLRSDVPAIAAAVRKDLPNILADSGDGDRAEHWLTRHHVNDPRILDALAATYVEVGSARDVIAINQRAIDTDARADAETRCRRLVRPIVLGTSSEQITAYEQLRALIRDPRTSNRTCEELDGMVRCWRNPGFECDGYLTKQGISHTEIALLEVYTAWPDGPAPAPRWLRIAIRAKDVMPIPGAADLMLAAFEGAIAAEGSVCNKAIYAAILQAESVMERVQQVPPPAWPSLHARCHE